LWFTQALSLRLVFPRRLRSAWRSHLTRIHFPLLGQCSDTLVGDKVVGVGFLQGRLDLADLPLVDFDI